MLLPQRHQKIVQVLARRGSVRTTDLAADLEVAEETVRRDFEKLEARGLLIRAHGGAVNAKQYCRDLPYYEREDAQIAEKQRIAEAALAHIKAGDIILLDASSTALQISKRLPDIPLTVLTNATQVVAQASTRRAVQVVCLGGRLQPNSLSFLGLDAERTLARYHVNKVFYSCRGVDPRRGLSEANEETARFKSTMLNFVDEAFLLADHAKLGVQSSFFFAPVSGAGRLITDRGADKKMLNRLQRAGLKWELAP